MPRKDSGLLSQERSAITDFPVWSASMAVMAMLGCRSATHATIQKLHNGHATRKCSVYLLATVMVLRWLETRLRMVSYVASPRVGAIGITAGFQRHHRRLRHRRHRRHIRHIRQVYLVSVRHYVGMAFTCYSSNNYTSWNILHIDLRLATGSR